MPSPVCVNCKLQMKLLKGGVIVEFRALTLDDGPYQQWMADLYGCERCGAHVTIGYGHEPTWEHFQREGHEPPFVSVPEVRYA